MKPLADELGERLAGLAAAGLDRQLLPASGLDFASNDYLGLGRDPAFRADLLARLAGNGLRLAPRTGDWLREAPEGAGPQGQTEPVPLAAPASRLLAGTLPVHLALEERLARFKGTEAALLFPSGYQANVGLLSALLAPGDRAISDAANHASLIDGLRLSGCTRRIVPHLDLGAIERELATEHPGGRTFLVTESLFSMDGDIAPLDRYADLAERHGADLIVDDAHATGLYGEARGSGLAESFGVERRALALVSTLGKALGAAGAFVAGPRVVIDYLVNRCRSFLFTTALSPLLVHATEAALDRIAAEPERRQRVFALAERLRFRLRASGLDCLASQGPLVPVILGDNRRAVAVAEGLACRGFDVRAARPPTVAPGTARLRISVHADRTEGEIDALAAALLAVLAGLSEESRV